MPCHLTSVCMAWYRLSGITYQYAIANDYRPLTPSVDFETECIVRRIISTPLGYTRLRQIEGRHGLLRTTSTHERGLFIESFSQFDCISGLTSTCHFCYISVGYLSRSIKLASTLFRSFSLFLACRVVELHGRPTAYAATPQFKLYTYEHTHPAIARRLFAVRILKICGAQVTIFRMRSTHKLEWRACCRTTKQVWLQSESGAFRFGEEVPSGPIGVAVPAPSKFH